MLTLGASRVGIISQTVDNIDSLLEDVEITVRDMVSLLVASNPTSTKALVSAAVLTAFVCSLYEVPIVAVSHIAEVIQNKTKPRPSSTLN